MSRHHGSRSGQPQVPIITLYDVPHTSAQPWAPNIWRVRFILNYKRLRYHTVWVEFPDVENTLRAIGARPTGQSRTDGRLLYTLPTIVDPTHNPVHPEIISNANHIAEYLETAYPARPVFPEGTRALQTLFVHYVMEIFVKPLLTIMVPLSHQNLPERSRSHFGQFGGMGGVGGMGGNGGQSNGHGALTPAQREQAWQAVEEQFNFLAMILDKNSVDGDGVVVMGRDVTYADFALCSVLIWIERMAAHDGWSRVKRWNNGRWARLWDRCREYMDVY
ncbi:hypothetical protein AX16_010894 [Volvariella volvacea WC 439]|nr:hypothetical protein AX16_010894 [Volvariella volvacea WC 439]